MMIKIRVMGTRKDIQWYKQFLTDSKDIIVEEYSEPYPNIGTNRYFRAYAVISRKTGNDMERNSADGRERDR